MKLVIDEEYYGLFLDNDNTGSVAESRALNEGFRKQDKRHITILGDPVIARTVLAIQ